MSTDAIVMLKADHREIKNLFRRFQESGDRATARRGKIVDQILEALTVHTYLENECMYPATRELLPDLEDDVLESYEEHHVADVLCMELAAMSPDDERFTAKTMVLIESVTHHIDEEEQDRRADAGAAQECSAPSQPTRCTKEGSRRGHQVTHARSTAGTVATSARAWSDPVARGGTATCLVRTARASWLSRPRASAGSAGCATIPLACR
jgi:hypothetical protein